MTTAFDLSYVQAQTLVLKNWECLNIGLVGCGGTGSWLAPSIVRLARVLIDAGKSVDVTFIDPDIIERANIYRQNFADCEIGLNKARALAFRYGAAWGMEISALAAPFNPSLTEHWYSRLSILIGCVDNAAARADLASTLVSNKMPPTTWWLDCGNHSHAGQVLLGSHNEKIDFFKEGICGALPSPSLQCPDLLQARPEESPGLSCAEMAITNAQSLSINQRVAAEASDFLLRLLVTKNLNRFATYFDLASGSCRSHYITPETVYEIFK